MFEASKEKSTAQNYNDLKVTKLNHKFTFVDLFAGIGGFHQALSSVGGKCVAACEIDEFARKTYSANHHIEEDYFFNDVNEIDPINIPDHDILCAGFPCQSFSIIGNMHGFKDARGVLFFDIIRILRAKKSPTFILENVKQLSTHNKGKTLKVIIKSLEDIGYKVYWQILNALDYGVPQKRERIIIIGFRNHNINFEFPEKQQTVSLNEIIEKDYDVERKYFASTRIVSNRMKSHTSKYNLSIWHENKSGNITSYPFSCALRAGASYNYLLVNGVRRLTPKEQLRLQGFPDNFKIVCNDAQIRKQTGNAVPVTMIQAVIKKILYATSKT